MLINLNLSIHSMMWLHRIRMLSKQLTTPMTKHSPVDANAASTSSGIHVLVISSAIQDPTVLEAAAKDPGHVVFYDPATTSLGQLSQDIASVLHGQQADSIAFVNEGKPGQFSLTQDVSSVWRLSNRVRVCKHSGMTWERW